MKIKDFNLMCKGFFVKRKNDQMQFANLAFVIDSIGAGLSGSKSNYDRFIKSWFGEESKPRSKEELKNRSDDIMRRVKATNKILEEKEKARKRIKLN